MILKRVTGGRTEDGTQKSREYPNFSSDANVKHVGIASRSPVYDRLLSMMMFQREYRQMRQTFLIISRSPKSFTRNYVNHTRVLLRTILHLNIRTLTENELSRRDYYYIFKNYYLVWNLMRKISSLGITK